MSQPIRSPTKEMEDLHIQGYQRSTNQQQSPRLQSSTPQTHQTTQNQHQRQHHSSFQGTKPTGIPTTYPHISADIQAKLHAFHEQRSKVSYSSQEEPLKVESDRHNQNQLNQDQSHTMPILSRKNSIQKEKEKEKEREEEKVREGTEIGGEFSKGLTPHINISNKNSHKMSTFTQGEKNKDEKPLPPLPPKSNNLNISLNKARTLYPPVRPAPSLPSTNSVLSHQTNIPFSQIPARTPQNTSKQSLSMRRGMRFPGGLPSLSNNDDNSPGVKAVGQPTPASTLSSRRPNLTLSQLQSDTPETKSSVSQLIDKKGKLPTQQSTQLKGLFANYSNYIDIKSGSLKFAGKLSLDSGGVDFSTGSSFRISSDELEFIEEIGRGNYGTVSKVLHKPTGVTMAMKEVRLELDESKFRQILMELEVLHKCNSPYIVDFYGAFFVEGAVYMCIEYMDGGSLDNIYGDGIDEDHLAYITESVIKGLLELKENHNIIHRDVKPTNILVSTSGKVKLCDFGVSGNLVASLARTNIGCQSYMAPERIKSLNPNDTSYSVQSDIWSLGLTILETSKGSYPYPPETYDNIFSQLSAIVDGEPPALPESFSDLAKDFVSKTLDKQPSRRPTYQNLLKHEWLASYEGFDFKMADYIKEKIRLSNTNDKSKPALHTGGANNLAGSS